MFGDLISVRNLFVISFEFRQVENIFTGVAAGLGWEEDAARAEARREASCSRLDMAVKMFCWLGFGWWGLLVCSKMRSLKSSEGSVKLPGADIAKMSGHFNSTQQPMTANKTTNLQHVS